jgi:CheY-like chemotaxis protein
MNRVLVIDDDDNVRSLLITVLQDLGCKVESASDGRDGVELFNRVSIDLVITDIRMPRINGNAVAKYIQSVDESNTPIVAISGYSEEADRELFDSVLMKPFNLQTLKEVVESFLPDLNSNCKQCQYRT